MTVSVADFKTRFPEFQSLDDSRIQLFIDDAKIILNPSFWGVKYDLGVSYHAAHELQLANKTAAGKGGVVGGITSRSVQDVSVSYGGMGSGSDKYGWAYYSQTAYGAKYYNMMNNLGVASRVV